MMVLEKEFWLLAGVLAVVLLSDWFSEVVTQWVLG